LFPRGALLHGELLCPGRSVRLGQQIARLAR
jgi:hypothetical protein